MILCRKDAEKLVLMIHRGQNTYADIRLAFPNMKLSTLYDLIADPFVLIAGEQDPRKLDSADILLRFQKRPADFHPRYGFKDDNAFVLSEAGENILYQLQKECTAEQHYQESLKESRIANQRATWSLVLAILAILVTVWQYLHPL